MPKILHSISVLEQAIAADGVQSFDLAVNPLSVVLLTLRPLNDTGTLANFAGLMALAAAMNRVSVLYRGESIVSMRGEDLAALNCLRHGIYPVEANPDSTNNERRALVIPLLLGRHAYDPKSCFPATMRGELVLEIDFDIADTGYDGLRFSAETIEILGASPSEYEKKVQVTQTFGATGDNDIDLVASNVNRGVLLFGTTAFAGATPAPTIGRLKVLMDNVEAFYTATDWEVAYMLNCLWGRGPRGGHAHTTLEVAGGGVETATSSTFNHNLEFINHVFLNFDPTMDDMYSLDTRGKSSFKVRCTAEAAEAVRAIPIEVIKA